MYATIRRIPMRPLEVLHGICHAFGSAVHLPEATASAVRWVLALLGPDASVRLVLPDGTGRLRVAASSGGEPTGGRKRSARRRIAFESKQPVLVDIRRPAGSALALVPLVSRGHAVGVLEVAAPRRLLQRRWATLDAIASQAAIVVRNLHERATLERQVETLGSAAALVRELVTAESLDHAVRSAVRLCYELLSSPVAGWSSPTGGNGLGFLAVRGVGDRKRGELRAALRSVPRWGSLPPADRVAIVSRFAEVLEVEDAVVLDGGDGLIVVAADPDSSGASLEVVGSLFQEVLRRHSLVARAQRRSEHLDLSLAWTAHEVRGPLLAAKTAIDRMLEGAPAEKGRDLLARSRHELTQLAGLVEAVLRWSVRAGGLHRRTVDLVRLVRDVSASCSLELERDDVQVDSPERLLVLADAKQLRSAVANVLRNAIAYSPPGLPVAVRVAQENGHAQVVVSDQGPGVGPSELDAIFDPFVRGEGGARRRAGKGLGLFIARRVVEAHGGVIRVESPGRGATFTIELPVNGGGTHARADR